MSNVAFLRTEYGIDLNVAWIKRIEVLAGPPDILRCPTFDLVANYEAVGGTSTYIARGFASELEAANFKSKCLESLGVFVVDVGEMKRRL